MNKAHTFHIPVMGIGYTIDTPLRVAQYGIDSSISLVDDILLEKMRKMYCMKYKFPYKEISDKIEDFRAKRITSYLNLINKIIIDKYEHLQEFTTEKVNEIRKYIQMLPDSSFVKQEFSKFTSGNIDISKLKNWLRVNFPLGSVDVNIMTKIDKDNYSKEGILPSEYKDAHAALRGFANSDLNSTIVFSAGMNPRLYSYIEQFEDFFPDSEGVIKKKIALKVSDYRSALIQGKFLAKKGLWVSEYRIESGLNCGGHAFATDGFLLGPILAEFRDRRKELIQTIHDTFTKALSLNKHTVPFFELPVKISAQGGIGTSEEHQFLINHYQLDSVGWGTPFLLVPEAVSIDEETIDKLIQAKEKDLFLSNISPLGVPFNSLKGNTKDIERLSYIAKGTPGSLCPKKYVANNNEFTEKKICTASRHYQSLKLKQLNSEDISPEAYQKKYEKIVEKSCICVGLGTSALIANNIDTKEEGNAISVCPGPNMAYFSKKMSLNDIVDHIYGRKNMIDGNNRPIVFIKELQIYLNFLKDRIQETKLSYSHTREKYLIKFARNLQAGVDYYYDLFLDLKENFDKLKNTILHDLDTCNEKLCMLYLEIKNLSHEKKYVG